MSKILSASCTGKVVTAEGLPVSTAEILSEGNGVSEGALLMDEEKQYYITSNATDIKQTLDALNQLIPKLVTIITSIGAGMTGPTTAPPPTLATQLAELTAINVQLTALKGMLK